ncbi:MAG: hypothetical protein ACOCYW_01925 [Roseicyclus sp.]
MKNLILAAALMVGALQTAADASTFQGQSVDVSFESPSSTTAIGSSMLGTGVDLVETRTSSITFDFDFGVNTLTYSFASTNPGLKSFSFFESGSDFIGYEFVFTDSNFPGLTSIGIREQTAGVTGTPSASLDGPNGFSIDLGGLEFLNVSNENNNLSEPASVTFEVTFAGDAAVVPVPPSLAMGLTMVAGFGLWARRRRKAA